MDEYIRGYLTKSIEELQGEKRDLEYGIELLKVQRDMLREFLAVADKMRDLTYELRVAQEKVERWTPK